MADRLEEERLRIYLRIVVHKEMKIAFALVGVVALALIPMLLTSALSVPVQVPLGLTLVFISFISFVSAVDHHFYLQRYKELLEDAQD